MPQQSSGEFASDVRVQERGIRARFSQCMQQHKILSTSNAISPWQERTEPSGHRPCRHGVKSSLRRKSDVPGDLLRALSDNVKGLQCHYTGRPSGKRTGRRGDRQMVIDKSARSREECYHLMTIVYTCRQPGLLGSIKCARVGPIPVMAMMAGSAAPFLTPS